MPDDYDYTTQDIEDAQIVDASVLRLTEPRAVIQPHRVVLYDIDGLILSEELVKPEVALMPGDQLTFTLEYEAPRPPTPFRRMRALRRITLWPRRRR